MVYHRIIVLGGICVKKALAMILSLIMIFSIFGCVPVVWAQEENLQGITSFVFNENTLTVTKGNDTNFEVVVYGSDDLETAATQTTNALGNTVYSLPSGANGELRVAIKKAGGSYVFSGSGTGHIVVKKSRHGGCRFVFKRPYLNFRFYFGNYGE